MQQERLHHRVRARGANPILYLLIRVSFQPFFWVYFRMQRIGREHIPARGPVIIAANHRSFLDPFVIACMARRPMYYVAKKEIFYGPVLSWILTALGAFPVDRGNADSDSLDTAKAILARGDIVLIFPEGTRTRPGALGRARRGVGRLALETGVPVVPVAVIGTEAVRKGIMIRPHRVRIRAGRPLQFPTVAHPSPALASAVTDRIWPCVMLQWEWLGGIAPIRRAAVIGAGAWGTALATMLARAGIEVELGCRTNEQAIALQDSRINDRYLPGVPLPDAVTVTRASELRLDGHDLVCVAVPARSLPTVMAAHGGAITSRMGVLVLTRGLVSPLGTLPAAFAAERCNARAVAVLGGPAQPTTETVAHGASLMLSSLDHGFSRQLRDLLRGAGLDVSLTSDVTGVELAGAASGAAALAAAVAVAASGTANVAGAAAGKVVAEVDALARTRGVAPGTFAGLAGTGDLITSLLAADSPDRRAGVLLAQGLPADELARALGRSVDAVETVPLLADAARRAQLAAPTLDALAAVVQGEIGTDEWVASISTPSHERSRAVRAA